MALSIPVEIWLLIASYVSKEDYDKLINVNSVFFNIIMDNRYRTVIIGYVDNDYMRRKLVRLCDPAVAPRVRRLCVYPCFNIYSRSRWNKVERDDWGFFKRLNFLRKDSAHIRSLLAAIKCMSNVIDFTVDWPGPIPTELKPFLPTAYRSFGPRLRSLTLGSAFPSVKDLVLSTPATRLLALEELCLEIGHDKYNSTWGSTRTMDAIDMGRSFARFVNRLAPQLRRLSISSRSEILDLCPLFSALALSFPALHHFRIRALFPKHFSSNPNALVDFLSHNSTTIRSADLVFLPSVVPVDNYLTGYSYYGSDDERLASWLEGLSADPVALSGLYSLKIYPTYSSQAGFNALVSLTRRSAETLTSLTVLVRYLTHEELTAIVSIFSANRSTDSCNLVTLRLNLRRLDPPIIRLLATNLPSLKKLSLHLMWRRHRFHKICEITASNMQGHFYPNWGLHDLGIWYDRCKVAESVLCLIAKAVPSIKSFKSESSWCEL